MAIEIRDAGPADARALARLWPDGWQDAHAEILPDELQKYRMLDSFTARVEKHLSNMRTAGPVGAPLGFTIILGDELDQLYVAAAARGTGLAQALIADAERRLSADGVRTAWLACAVGNRRAARFYEKCGWVNMGAETQELKVPTAVIPVEVWRFEKVLGAN